MIAYLEATQESYASMMQAYENGSIGDADVRWQIERGAVATGYWDDPVGKVIINTIGAREQIQALIDYLDVSRTWWWDWSGLVSVDDELAGQHDDLLALQKEPASFDSPNWAHGYYGQGARSKNIQVFARSCDRSFSKAFR